MTTTLHDLLTQIEKLQEKIGALPATLDEENARLQAENERLTAENRRLEQSRDYLAQLACELGGKDRLLLSPAQEHEIDAARHGYIITYGIAKHAAERANFVSAYKMTPEEHNTRWYRGEIKKTPEAFHAHYLAGLLDAR